jgi:hypothetical protein
LHKLSLAIVWCLLPAPPLWALDRIVVARETGELTLAGRVFGEADDRRLLLLTPDGALWPILANEREALTRDDEPFVPLGPADQARTMLQRLPPGFDVHRTKHYVVCYNGNKAYAAWCGGLFERLYAGFYNYFTQRGLKLTEPEFPLVAIVFADEASYQAHAKQENASHVVGYYSLLSNRVTMYDLTGAAAVRKPGDARGSTAQINDILRRPGAAANVATVVHEATHQLAFNCGLHARLADIPLWVSEGMAVYFESPDLASPQGWRTIGAVHHSRLAHFREYLAAGRPHDSLLALVADDRRLRDPKLAKSAYAEAWVLNHMLLKRRPKEYVQFLKSLSAKKPLQTDSLETRLAEFRAAFGDVARLDAELVRHAAQLK